MIMKIIVDTVVKIKRRLQCLSCVCCVSLDLFALFSFVDKEAILSVAASIQGRLLFFFFYQFVRFLFEGGFLFVKKP